MAAQKFLDKNQISQTFLEQVANFIIKNTTGVTIGPASQVSDPLTGNYCSVQIENHCMNNICKRCSQARSLLDLGKYFAVHTNKAVLNYD